jgi:hypothetical protein
LKKKNTRWRVARSLVFPNLGYKTAADQCLVNDLPARLSGQKTSVNFRLHNAFAVVSATHGVTFHLWWTLRYREYSV